MKRLALLAWILLLCIVVMISCKSDGKEDKDQPQPGPTSPSELQVNTITAVVNDTLLEFHAPDGRSYLGVITVDQSTKQNKFSMDGSVEIIDGYKPIKYLRFQVMPSIGLPTPYPIIWGQYSGNEPNFILYSSGPYGKTVEWRATKGTFEITKSENNLAEGKFDCTMVALKEGTGSIDTQKKPIEIKDGLFNIRFRDGR